VTLLGVLGMGRNMANARMTETVRVGELLYGEVPEGDIDPDQVFTATYDGPARVSWKTYTVQQTTPGDQPVALSTPILSLPSGTLGVTVDMRVIVDASTADTSIVGRTFRIKGLPQSGQTTAFRFPLEEAGEVIEETS
jgi:hypothetical protein